MITKTIVNTEEYIYFLRDHEYEIRGTYNDKFWKNGGWNGLMDSVKQINKKHHLCFGEGIDIVYAIKTVFGE